MKEEDSSFDSILTRNAGDKILPLIKRAERELIICSPFISPRYANLLVEKAREGVEVEVLTTGNSADYHQRALRKLRQDLKPPKTKRNAGVGLIFMGVVWVLTTSVIRVLALFPALLMFTGGGYLLAKHFGRDESQTEPEGEVKIQIVDDLHAKLYSRDGGEETIFGSANLTNSGMSHNLEVIGRED